VSPQVADALFAALARGPMDADESAVLGSTIEPALYQQLTTQAHDTASARANLARLLCLWATGD